MLNKLSGFLRQYRMLNPGDRVTCAVSGGADSVALLHVLCSMKEEFQWNITAVHIHHGLRGADADGDMAFAESFCEKLGIPCVARKVDVKAEAKARKICRIVTLGFSLIFFFL